MIRIGAAATVLYFLLLHVRAYTVAGVSHADPPRLLVRHHLERRNLFFQELVPGQPGLATTIFTNAANVGNLVGYFSFGSFLVPLGHRGLFLVSATSRS